MRLKEYLVLDLKRMHDLSGRESAQITGLALLKGCLSPRFMPVTLCRFAQVAYQRGWRRTGKFFALINFVTFGLEVAPQIPIGPGIFFPHTQGTVVGARLIGSNATIFHQVTLGARKLDMGFAPELRPELGDNVTLGTGAKILGGIKIGNGVTVGANSVVLADVPDGVLCVGNPARVVRYNAVRDGWDSDV